jgi:hypothetical protein
MNGAIRLILVLEQALLSCFGTGFSSLRLRSDVDGKARVRCVHQRGRRPGNIYNEWYTDVLLKDVLKVPGIVAAQRFKMSDVQRDAPPFHGNTLLFTRLRPTI